MLASRRLASRLLGSLTRARRANRIRLTASRKVSTSTPSAAKRRQVFSWGEAKKGCLGLGPEETSIVVRPAPVLVLEGEDVVKVKCFGDTSGALTARGELYLWGDNAEGKISSDGESSKFYPFKVDGLEGLDIQDFDIGQKHAMVLDSEGNVYTWGWGGSFFQGAGALGHGDKASCDTPTLVEAFISADDSDDGNDAGLRIAQIASGGRHSVALDEDGTVWTWGQGEYGRLGNGGSSDSLEPEPLEFFDEIGACKEVRSGSSFSAAITADHGHLYTWGKNNDGQLAIGNPLSMGFAMETYPRQVTEGLPKDDPIKELTLGSTHMLMLMESGALYTAGMKIFNIPSPVPLTEVDSLVVQVSAGKNISAAVTEAGHGYSWSKGRLQSKFLGHGAEGVMSEMEKEPRRIEDLDHAGRVVQIECGNKHMLALVEVEE